VKEAIWKLPRRYYGTEQLANNSFVNLILDIPNEAIIMVEFFLNKTLRKSKRVS